MDDQDEAEIALDEYIDRTLDMEQDGMPAEGEQLSEDLARRRPWK